MVSRLQNLSLAYQGDNFWNDKRLAKRSFHLTLERMRNFSSLRCRKRRGKEEVQKMSAWKFFLQLQSWLVCVCVCVVGWAAGNTWLPLARPGVAGKCESPDVAAGHRGARKLPPC